MVDKAAWVLYTSVIFQASQMYESAVQHTRFSMWEGVEAGRWALGPGPP